MSAPDGFDPKASMLPDPGAASAPIHVMRGGGNKGPVINTNSIQVEMDDNLTDPETQKILKQYQLGPGGKLEHLVNDEVKQLFVKQIQSKLCTAGTGNSVITHKDCSAVVQVLRELYKLQIMKSNSYTPQRLNGINNTNSITVASESNNSDADTEEGQLENLLDTIRSRLNAPHAGLVNCGNTCYLNSALQMLSYIPDFIEALQEGTSALEETIQQKRRNLTSIISKLYISDAPVDLSKSGDLIMFDDFFDNLHRQQDAGEFIQLIFDRLQLNTTKFKYNRSELLECNDGQIEGTEEKRPVQTEDLILRLELPEQTSTVQDLVNKLGTTREPVDDLGDCKNKENPQATKGPASRITTYTIDDTNKYVFVLLTRFDLNGNKVNTGITVNDYLNFLNKRYRLYGSVLHSGASLERGHYIFMKVKDDLRSGILYNDEKVESVDNIYTPDHNDSFTLNNNSYILFYKRDEPELISESGIEMADQRNTTYDKLISSVEKLLASIGERNSNIVKVKDVNLERLDSIIEKIPQKNTFYKDKLTRLYIELKAKHDLAQMQKQITSNQSGIAVQAEPTPPGTVASNTDVQELNRVIQSAVLPSASPISIPSTSPTSQNRVQEVGNQGSMTYPASSPNNLQVVDMSSFENNPPNFQEGHMRINFGAPENKRVYANARIGQIKTRISGRNAANLKSKYNTRKRNLEKKAQNLKGELERLRAQNAEQRQRNQEALQAAQAAREEAKRKLKEAEATAKRVAESKSTAKKTLQQTTASGVKSLEQKQKELREAEIAAGLAPKKTLANRFKGMFKRGGRKTQRKTRRRRN